MKRLLVTCLALVVFGVCYLAVTPDVLAAVTYFLWAPDDKAVRFGTDSDFDIEYVSANDALEVQAGATVLQQIVDAESRFGGGYGATGVDITHDGNLSLNGYAVVDDYLTVGGGYAGGSGATIATSGAIQTNSGLTVDTNSLFGGGYSGGTGATIFDTGNISTNGVLTVDSNVVVGGGYGSGSGLTLGSDGSITADGAASFDTSMDVGGGYGDTGSSLSTDGSISLNLNAVVDGYITSGGGYGATGVTLAADGDISGNGDGMIDGYWDWGGGYGSTGGRLEADGDVTMDGDLTVDGGIAATGGVGVTGNTDMMYFNSGTSHIDFDDWVVHFNTGVLFAGAVEFANSSIASLDVGGGYGSTGASIESDGDIKTNKDITADGYISVGGGSGSTGTTLGADGDIASDGKIDWGGGYGSTGGRLDDDGDLSMNGNLTVGGTFAIQTATLGTANTVRGSATFNRGDNNPTDEPGYITLYSTNGVAWYFHVENDGTLKYSRGPVTGTLDTRTDDDTGVISLATHTFITSDTVEVYWNGNANSRLGMTATVSADNVTVDGGAGDNLPVTTTVMTVFRQDQNILGIPIANADGDAVGDQTD